MKRLQKQSLKSMEKHGRTLKNYGNNENTDWPPYQEPLPS
jgi:hypothetical protein